MCIKLSPAPFQVSEMDCALIEVADNDCLDVLSLAAWLDNFLPGHSLHSGEKMVVAWTLRQGLPRYGAINERFVDTQYHANVHHRHMYLAPPPVVVIRGNHPREPLPSLNSGACGSLVHNSNQVFQLFWCSAVPSTRSPVSRHNW